MHPVAFLAPLTGLASAALLPDRFRLDVALSLTQTNKRGGPEYVQVRLNRLSMVTSHVMAHAVPLLLSFPCLGRP